METIRAVRIGERRAPSGALGPSPCNGRAAALLARVTDLPRGALREAILGLPEEEREHLDSLAGEILDDARAYRTIASYR
jgi:hypothetical protein